MAVQGVYHGPRASRVMQFFLFEHSHLINTPCAGNKILYHISKQICSDALSEQIFSLLRAPMKFWGQKFFLGHADNFHREFIWGKGVSVWRIKCLPVRQCLQIGALAQLCINQRWYSSRSKEFVIYLSLGLEDHLILPLRTSLYYWEVLQMWRRKGNNGKVRPVHHFITQVGEGEVLFPVQGGSRQSPYPRD